jgi:hypothetical protein
MREQIAAQLVKHSLGGVHRCTQVYTGVHRCTQLYPGVLPISAHLDDTWNTQFKHTSNTHAMLLEWRNLGMEKAVFKEVFINLEKVYERG